MALDGCAKCGHVFHGAPAVLSYNTTRPDTPDHPCPLKDCYCHGGEMLVGAVPEKHEISRAMVITEWTCALCKAENDVWGEGAIGHWMECSQCGRETWLSFDKGIATELGQR